MKQLRFSRKPSSESGTILVVALICSISLFGLVLASTTLSSLEMKLSRRSLDDVKAGYLAESGVEQSIHYLRDAARKTNFFDPLYGLNNLFTGGAINPFVGQAVTEGSAKAGEFSVTMTSASDANGITVTIVSTGYVPAAPVNLPAGNMLKSWHSISAKVRFELGTSPVFDYGYFINNWGWFYGNSIICNGNVRSNGQFDAAHYQPWVNCQPLYEGVTWDGVTATLNGYQDDNNDGLSDGNDGGVFSSWDIVNAENLRGQGGNAANQHDFVDPVEMPNLTDMTQYESKAITEGGQVSINGSVVSNAVYGDEAGEKQNLYLIGTDTDPVEITGKIIVRGDVIISGKVTGQGAIFAGGNIYVPDSVQYLNGPATTRPAGNTQAQTETWLNNSMDKDFLGLFARENVVIGDHTNSSWRSNVSGWMNHSMNKSEEDAGEDGIPNTTEGKDGIAGTADDDLLEDDGVFSTELYTQSDSDLGLIPPGKNVGDPIPGTGEDIDGDGAYDNTISLSDIDLSTALDDTNWGGNIPVGTTSYSSIASMYANTLDATFYTNHSFCYVVLGAQVANVNGAIVSRNEDIIYGTPSININYDCRLLGGGAGSLSGYLPKVLKPIQILRWESLDVDSNFYLP
ncbi:MAG: hypothetical protein ABIK28_08580 [Planctomycetota bacterium]